MRFVPSPSHEETVVVRIRVPLGLRAKYQAAAQENQMEISELFCQALRFAAEDDSNSDTARTRKKPRQSSSDASRT